MQDCSQLMAHPTGTLDSIAVTAVNTLTPPNVTGALQGMSYCPGSALPSLTAGPYR